MTLTPTIVFGVAVLAVPAAAFVLLAALTALPGRRSERTVANLATGALALSLLATLGTLVSAWEPLTHGGLTVPLGAWFSVPGYSLQSVLLLDLPGAVFMTLTTSLIILVSVYSARYLHREPGFARFFLLLLLFSVGMLAIAAGGSLDIVFGGWELVGSPRRCSSRSSTAARRRCATASGPSPSTAPATWASWRAWCSSTSWCTPASSPTASRALTAEQSPAALNGIALLFVLAAMGKSAMLPFTGWLPRAMEGPTPSSAIFYGALSIHAGPFLLLRLGPLLDAAPAARAVIVVTGVLTALHATTVGRAQTDIKSKLAYASVAQVSLIWVELGLGLYTLALVHIVGHATLRTWELLRAPSYLRDWRVRQQLQRDVALGTPRGRSWLPLAWRDALYRVTLERWYLDELATSVIGRMAAALRALDTVDRKVAAQLDGPAVEPAPAATEGKVQRGVS
jgi:NADH-quinone oxidoreductase subunit L